MFETRMRTHTCGELNAKLAGENVVLSGWMHHERHHGGVLFIDLRDRYGRTQITFKPELKELFDRAEKLNHEDVIQVRGTVTVRPPEARNSKMPTGEIEVIAEELKILGKAQTPPFVIEDDVNAMEDTRLKYRYLDLRRPEMRDALLLRGRANMISRKYFAELGFVDIETSTLVRSTPEGARDFLVPSRKQKGRFYALPQSPQIYKQLLMIAGFDRYYQFARCYRDEDLRADRQPEFTQIDVEMSFVEQEDVLQMAEGLMARLLHEVCGASIKQPIRRMGYDEAMLRFGSDKPDTRFGLEIEDVSDIAEKSDFNVFSGTVEKGGAVRCLYVHGGGELSRKDIDNLTELAKKYGAKGLAQCKFVDGEFSGGIAKFLGENEKAEFVKRFSPEDGSIFMFVADKPLVCARTLGAIRLEMGKRFDLIDKSKWDMLFVVDFPMFEFDEESGRPVAQHHAFTMVRPEDVDKLESDPMAVRSVAYDLVLNGHEIAGGSIRTHDPAVLRRVMKAIKLSDEEADEKFGFLMEAMKYGAPPHGGIAFGWDRIIMLLAGMDSIRDVIAFPKTTAAQSLMDGCPNDVDLKQLEELGIKLIKEGK